MLGKIKKNLTVCLYKIIRSYDHFYYYKFSYYKYASDLHIISTPNY